MGHLSPWPDSNLPFSDICTHPTFLQQDSYFPPGLCPHHFCCLDHPFFCLCLFPTFLFLQSQDPRPQTCQASPPMGSSFLCPSTARCLPLSQVTGHFPWSSCSVPSSLPDTVSSLCVSLYVSACVVCTRSCVGMRSGDPQMFM